jgi:hypothetical protein
MLAAMHSAQRLERPAAGNCSNKRGIQRFRIRAFTAGQARMTLNDARSATLQARSYGFESPWLHYLPLSEALLPAQEALKGRKYSSKVQQRWLGW